MNESIESTRFAPDRKRKNSNNPITTAEKLAIFEEYLKEEATISQLAAKYGRGISTISTILSTFAAELSTRPDASAAIAADANPTSKEDIFMGKERELKLAQQVKELQAQLKKKEKELEHEHLGHLFYEKMVEIAERDLHLEIRKKYGAKQ